MNNEDLLAYCETPRQRQVVEALIQAGGAGAAAKALGCTQDNIRRIVRKLRKRAALDDPAVTEAVVESFNEAARVRRVSAYYKEDGSPGPRWVQYQTDALQLKAVQQAILEAAATKLPREKLPDDVPRNTAPDLLAQYTVTDYHIGMLAVAEESGETWDLPTAENLLVEWFTRAIQVAPAAEQAVLAQLGDFMHWDSLTAVTPAHRHVLDAATRYNKLSEVALRVTRRIIRLLLQKHQRVHVICAEGNHDEAGSGWLRVALAALYEGSDRVTVETRQDPYYAFEWGDTSLFFHHGHKRKPTNIDHVFAAKFRELFGRTRHSYGHLGHYHHDRVFETSLMTIEQHRTLCPPDAHASRGGWMSGRDAKVLVYHRRYGAYERHILSPTRVHEELENN